MVRTDGDYFYLEPTATPLSAFPGEEETFHHTISKSGLRGSQPHQECGTKIGGKGGGREGGGGRGSRGGSYKRRKRLVTSREYFVETTVVTDRSMLNYHQHDALEAYVFTLMNIVSSL